MLPGVQIGSGSYDLGGFHGRFLIQTPAAGARFPTFPALVWGRTLTMDGIVTIFALAKGQIIDPAQTCPLFITLVA
jgi:hypothetical protein